MPGPAAARRRLRFALRSAREAAGLTQAQVAVALEWSVSKVIRIESGDVTISVSDLEALANHLGITDPTQLTDMIDDVGRARSGRWNGALKGASGAYREYFALEAEATALRLFDTILVPGFLQTDDYANASSNTSVSRDAGAKAVAGERRVLLDESVLHRVVGGPLVMADQLTALLRAVRDDRLTLRVMPFAAPVVVACEAAFGLLDVGDVLLFRYRPLLPLPAAAGHVEAYERMWTGALDHDATIGLIADHIARYLRLATSAVGEPKSKYR